MSSTRCAACKHLRRRCPSDCIFAPYFPASNKQRFVDVHRIYGASNIGKMLQDLPVYLRAEAANSLCYEAYCRKRDPVYGSVGVITVLQQQLHDLQSELAQVQADIVVVAAAHAQTDQLIQQVDQHMIFDFPDQNGDPYDDASTYFFV